MTDCTDLNCDTCISVDRCEWCGVSENCFSSATDSCINNLVSNSCPLMLYLEPSIVIESKQELLRINVEGVVQTNYSCLIDNTEVAARNCTYIYSHIDIRWTRFYSL